MDLTRQSTGVHSRLPSSSCHLGLTSVSLSPTLIVWPASLQQLSFGGYFSQPFSGVVCPVTLWQLSFGCCFNQPIADVVWPASLQQLSFGYAFSQPYCRSCVAAHASSAALVRGGDLASPSPTWCAGPPSTAIDGILFQPACPRSCATDLVAAAFVLGSVQSACRRCGVVCFPSTPIVRG